MFAEALSHARNRMVRDKRFPVCFVDVRETGSCRANHDASKCVVPESAAQSQRDALHEARGAVNVLRNFNVGFASAEQSEDIEFTPREDREGTKVCVRAEMCDVEFVGCTRRQGDDREVAHFESFDAIRMEWLPLNTCERVHAQRNFEQPCAT